MKVNGEWVLRYFGRWANVKSGQLVPVGNKDAVRASGYAAEDEYKRQLPYLVEGRTPPPQPDAPDDESVPTLANICNAFLRSKRAAMFTDELSPRTYRDYERTTDLLIDHFGRERRVDDLRPDDFQKLRLVLAERYGTVTRANEINRIRIVFKFAWDHRRQWTLTEPVDFGQEFKRPSAKVKRRARREAGIRMFEAHELRTTLDALDGKPIAVEGLGEPVQRPADAAMKAMVLLGLNCGFGNTDCATLPQSALDLEAGWIEHPRPKTEIDRRIPLWTETVVALQAALAVRPGPAGREYRDLCFLTRSGMPWVRVQSHAKKDDMLIPLDPLGQKFTKLLKRLRINGRRGLGFYTLRHVTETIGGGAKDQVALDAIMGHVDTSMAAEYREGIADDRLRAVVDFVHGWLFGSEGGLR
jgi:integrase